MTPKKNRGHFISKKVPTLKDCDSQINSFALEQTGSIVPGGQQLTNSTSCAILVIAHGEPQEIDMLGQIDLGQLLWISFFLVCAGGLIAALAQGTILFYAGLKFKKPMFNAAVTARTTGFVCLAVGALCVIIFAIIKIV